ncbi:hypothetical protein NKR19_g633 [Coniochaeta hoffmannii]|uniref:Uncharacterized protein n=1 Tax=Coniochaeta hoffmannii TaxID=91930 RepID=A0AA38VTU7_9PEZI|nr:hypothetical protein NKR19_g633 [Coniochaeta hoffmannii]
MAEQQYRDEPEALNEPHTTAEDATDAAEIEPRWKQDSKPGRRIFSVRNIAIAAVSVALLVTGVVLLTRHSTTPRARPVPSAGHSKSNQVKQKHAVSYHLDFPALYPDITSEAGSECRAAWASLVAVPCHDKVFDRSTDNGTFRPLGWDPLYVLPKICQTGCQAALEDAYRQVSAQCTSDDRFVLDGYHGMFNPSYLEAGPAAAVGMLLRRTQHLCRSSPFGDSDYQYCPAELYDRFAVVDGLNAEHNLFKGVARFVHETDRRRTEPPRWKSGTRGSGTYSYRYNFHVRKQSYGPGPGETSCDWCIFDYLNRTLNSWTPGAVTNPDTGEQVSLPEFIRRVRTAGERCSPTLWWSNTYKTGIERYRSAGLLSADWETAQPSGDLSYLILNGPSLGDSPVAEIHAELQRLYSNEFLADWTESDSNTYSLQASRVCLMTLKQHYTSAGCFINLSRDELSRLLDPKEKRLRSAYCGEPCTKALDTFAASACDSPRLIPSVREFADQYRRAREQRETYCGAVGQESWAWDCGAALLNGGKASWAIDGLPATPTLLAEIGRAVDELEAEKPVPEELREALAGDAHRLPSGAPREARGLERRWLRDLGTGICAGCVWDWLAGPNRSEVMRGAESVAGYVEFARRYHAFCTSRGATWMGGVPYGDDPVVWRVKDEFGRVMRYIESPKTGFHQGWVYGVNEANGQVSVYGANTRGNVPGVHVGSLWHVLQAARAQEARDKGEWERWSAEEEEHRQKADSEIWEVSWGSVSYIGPKGGLEEKADS